MKAVEPTQAVATSTAHQVNLAGNPARKLATASPPSRPHRPRVLWIRPPDLVARRNQPMAKPPAAGMRCSVTLKKNIPNPAPRVAAMSVERRYRPRSVGVGGDGEGGCRFGSTLFGCQCKSLQ
jgi:hypothetical protein